MKPQAQAAIKRVAVRLTQTDRQLMPSVASARAYAEWEARARLKQIRPHANHKASDMRRDDWLIWMLDAGRGFGKTAAGAAETIRQSQDSPFLAIVADNFADGRDQCIEGESGIKSLLGKDLRWNRSNGEMTFPSGAKGKIFSAADPESLRGPNNYFAWLDEFGKWRYQKEAWDQLMFTLRKGRAQCVITTTPRPSPLSKRLKAHPRTVVTKGSTYENIANLAEAFIESTIKPYEGTALGRQELEAQDIDNVPGALWTREMIEANRRPAPDKDDLVRLVVAIDPATTANEDSDETGIIAAAVDKARHAYVLADGSLKASPHGWAIAATDLYRLLQADRMIAEANNGGEMVAHTLRMADSNVSLTLVHASRGKRTRAEPISALYERGLVHHVGTFPLLEDQMCTWVQGQDSPDRLDALVWALTDLIGQPFGVPIVLDW